MYSICLYNDYEVSPKHTDEISTLSQGKEYVQPNANSSIAVSYPLRADFTISFSIPSDITKE